MQGGENAVKALMETIDGEKLKQVKPPKPVRNLAERVERWPWNAFP